MRFKPKGEYISIQLLLCRNDRLDNVNNHCEICSTSLILFSLISILKCTRFIRKVPGLLPFLKCLVSDTNRKYMLRKMNTRPVI